MDKYFNEIKNNLNSILDENTASNLLNAMFPKRLTDYGVGEILTIGELKKMPKGSVIYLWYDGEIGFVVLDHYSGGNEIATQCGYPMPIGKYSDDTLIEMLDNLDCYFTVREAIPLN